MESQINPSNETCLFCPHYCYNILHAKLRLSDKVDSGMKSMVFLRSRVLGVHFMTPFVCIQFLAKGNVNKKGEKKPRDT